MRSDSSGNVHPLFSDIFPKPFTSGQKLFVSRFGRYIRHSRIEIPGPHRVPFGGFLLPDGKMRLGVFVRRPFFDETHSPTSLLSRLFLSCLRFFFEIVRKLSALIDKKFRQIQIFLFVGCFVHFYQGQLDLFMPGVAFLL